METCLTDVPPMTMAQALGPIPEFVRDQMGETALLRCFKRAGLAIDLLDEQVGYVPEIAIDRFLESAARQSGESLFGLKVAPLLSVRDYGLWGDYVLAAGCLGTAIHRAIQTMGIHASGDVLFVRAGSATRKLCYLYAARDHIGYRQVALAAAGVAISIPCHYLGAAWRPVSLGLDIPEVVGRQRIEEAFGCPVYFNRDCIEVEIEARHFDCPKPEVGTPSILTVHDVRRAFAGGPPRQFPQVIASVLYRNLGQTRTDLESIAQTLNVSTRTLQRRLEAEGTSFRNVLADVKICRATELLQDSALSISDIAVLLDYATTSHFIRAFKTRFGTTPNRHWSRH